MTHTPGPWHTCHDAKCSCFTVMADHHPVAQITHGVWGDEWPEVKLVPTDAGFKAEAYTEMMEYGSVSEEVARANWRLIAAAPDLLAALLAFIEPFRLTPDYVLRQYPDTPQPRNILAAREVIARATGETK